MTRERNGGYHGEQQIPGAVVLLPVPLLGEVVELLGELLQAHVTVSGHLLLPHLLRRHGSHLLLGLALHLGHNSEKPLNNQPLCLSGLVLWKEEAWVEGGFI